MLPFHDRDGFIWMDGDLVPWRDATLHSLSHGLHYGSCVFEGERAYGGEVFAMTEHHERLLASARALRRVCPEYGCLIRARCNRTLSSGFRSSAKSRRCFTSTSCLDLSGSSFDQLLQQRTRKISSYIILRIVRT